MGLDMYLFRKGANPQETEQVGQWRKANAIHRWFVDRVQGGEDDCREAPVSREQLAELRALCLRVLDEARVTEGAMQNGSVLKGGQWEPILEQGFVVTNPETCAALLPTTKGFFYGSTDYDEYYLEDVKKTVEILDAALARDGEYFYWSSW